MTHTFLSALVLLLLIMDPFGNIPLFVSTLKNIEAKRRWKIICREHLIAFFILFVFMLIGEKFLKSIGLSSESIQIAGGLVLFLISIKMIFPSINSEFDEIKQEEPLIVPLAIPLIAGPSALATVMLLVSQEPTRIIEWILALSLAILGSAIILLLADKFQHKLGSKFIFAIEKLMGLILVALSVEMIIRGIKTLIGH
ncbi:NAAT family transporter [archaeon]|nr:NAAT family transporter [archaeon]